MEVIQVPVEWIDFLEAHPMDMDTLRYVVGIYNSTNDDTVTLVRDLVTPEKEVSEAEVLSVEPEDEYGPHPDKPGKTETTVTPAVDGGEEKEIT